MFFWPGFFLVVSDLNARCLIPYVVIKNSEFKPKPTKQKSKNHNQKKFAVIKCSLFAWEQIRNFLYPRS